MSAWLPVMVPKGYDVFNDYHRYTLVDGPRKAAKTMSILNKVCRHLYEWDGARFGVVTKTTKAAKSGVWSQLLDDIIPFWIDSGTFRFIQHPKMEADSKMSWFSIRNQHGGESRCELHPLQHESEALQRFKSTTFSGLFLSEADLWDTEDVFTGTRLQLRGCRLPYEAYQLIIDCNPPESGKEHWLYDLFWNRGGIELTDAQKTEHQKNFHRIPFVLTDNTLIDPREIQDLIEGCRHDKNLMDRWVHGLWERSTISALFKQQFSRPKHVFGNVVGPRETWELLMPQEGCLSLIGGWDLGEVNHAFGIIAPREFGAGEPSAFDIIDELVVLNPKHPMGIEDFAVAALARVEFWERVLKANEADKVHWRHWSDPSSLRFRSSVKTDDRRLVYLATDGKIKLHGVDKGEGSVKDRVSMLRRMLHKDRVAFSAARCPNAIEMLEKLPPGRDGRDGLMKQAVEPTSRYKHIFDALTYALSAESPADLMRKMKPRTAPIIRIAA